MVWMRVVSQGGFENKYGRMQEGGLGGTSENIYVTVLGCL